VNPSRSNRPSTTRWAAARRKAALSLITVATAAGVMGLATFGTFDNASDTITRSVASAAGTAH
jgi:hypothetical protein